jgi:hypothetical protein
MPSTTFRPTGERRNARVVAAGFLISIFLLMALIILVGRIPVSGNVAIDGSHSDRFEKIMKENGILFWTGISSMGMMWVRFDNPFPLRRVDDLILDDARRNNYQAIIEYKCVVPYFNHTVTAL